MRKRQLIGVVVFAIGVVLLVTSGFRLRQLAVQEGAAQKSWSCQQQAHAEFRRDSAEVAHKLQVGEIDNAGWHREVEVFSTKFKTESEAAGKAWVDQCASAQRLRPQITGLVAAGLICMVGGAIIFRSRAKPCAMSPTPSRTG